MSSEPPKRVPLPFEPRQKKKKVASKPSPSSEAKPAQPAPLGAPVKTPVAKSKKTNKKSGAIPEVVSKRMLRRMAGFSGVPTGLALSSFFIFYWIVTNEVFNIPTTAVVITTFGLFGLGVLGLSYGLISASWDEERVGSLLGWEEFTLNLGRLTSAWRSAKKEAKSK